MNIVSFYAGPTLGVVSGRVDWEDGTRYVVYLPEYNLKVSVPKSYIGTIGGYSVFPRELINGLKKIHEIPPFNRGNLSHNDGYFLSHLKSQYGTTMVDRCYLWLIVPMQITIAKHERELLKILNSLEEPLGEK